MKLKVKRLKDNAVLPTYAKVGDAGMDLTATSKEELNGRIKYGTGVAVEIPEGHVGLLFPRSSIYKTSLNLANSVGVIDSGYRGEVCVIFRLTGSGTSYKIGDRIAQLVVLPYPDVAVVEVDELSDSDRNSGGFGSTGE